MYPNSTHRFFGEIFVFGLKTGIDSIPEKRQKKKGTFFAYYISLQEIL